MMRRIYLLLYLAALIAYAAAAYFQTVPGYMDAEYYFAGGVELARGNGFQEQVIWNYLNDPDGIPQPSHAYWMPLVSILSAAFMGLFNGQGFEQAQLGFLILGAFIPVLTARLAYSLTASRSDALFAGIVAVFPGFYFPYLPTSDSFTVTIILGYFFVEGISRLTRLESISRASLTAGLVGILGGLLHLTRTEGIVWIALGAVWLAWKLASRNRTLKEIHRFYPEIIIGMYALGYLLCMAPWMVRNWQEFGSFLSPGGIKGLWIVSYDELFSYPAELLTFQHWLGQGGLSLVASRWDALVTNLQTTLAVQGQVFLLPFVIIGFWKYRKQETFQFAGLIWLALFLLMTVIFPQIGERGGYFHAAAGIQILIWSSVPAGFEEFVRIGERKRGWNAAQASRIFRASLGVLAIIVTLILGWQRVIGSELEQPVWNASSAHYAEIEVALEKIGAAENAIVMVNNPPGYYVTNDRAALVIPHGNLQVVLEAASRYRAQYLILEDNYSTGKLADIYHHPETAEGLIFLADVDDTRIFKFSTPEG